MSNVEESELNISQDILDDLMRALETLESSTDLEGTALVTKNGLRVASSEMADVTADLYSASPATLISLGEKISEGLKQGDLEDIIIRGAKGYTIILVGDKDNEFMLFSNCKKVFKLGYYLHKLKKAFRIMQPLLKQIKI